MSYLDPVRFVIVGDRAKAMSYASFARKMLYDLTRKGADSGVVTARSQRTLADGTSIEVSIDGLQATARIDVTGGKQVTGKFLVYVMKAGALCTYDIAKKEQIGTITGLTDFVLGDCTKGGEFVYLTQPSGGTTSTVRVDVRAITAIGYNYPVNTLANTGGGTQPGLAIRLDDTHLSPDENSVLLHFAASATTGGVVKEGIGGLILANAETLAPLRVPIRMGFQPMPNLWKSDSSRFYVATTVNTDSGDITGNASLTTLVTSPNEYVSVFDGAGVFLGSRLITTWSMAPPDSGFSRRIKSMALSPNGERLYVAVIDDIFDPGSQHMLYALDASDDLLPIVNSVVLPDTPGTSAFTEMSVNRAGNRLVLHVSGTTPMSVIEFDLEDDALSQIHMTSSDRFYSLGSLRSQGNDMFKNGPREAPKPFDTMRFMMVYAGAPGYLERRLYGYGTFDEAPKYEYDFNHETVSIQYLLFAERPQETKK